MKKVKGVIVVITGLFIIITLFSLIMPSKVMTARSVVIHADPRYVYSEIANLNEWKHWHPVFMNDSSSIKVTSAAEGINAAAIWSTNGKENKLMITEVGINSIRLSLTRPGENDISNIISVNHVNDSSAIQVDWQVLTKLKWYPWEKFYGIFVDKLTGPGYEAALNNLKELAENRKR